VLAYFAVILWIDASPHPSILEDYAIVQGGFGPIIFTSYLFSANERFTATAK